MFRYTEKKVKTKSDTKWLHIPNYTLHGLHLFTPLSLASSKPSLTCASIYTTFSHLFNSRPTQHTIFQLLSNEFLLLLEHCFLLSLSLLHTKLLLLFSPSQNTYTHQQGCCQPSLTSPQPCLRHRETTTFLSKTRKLSSSLRMSLPTQTKFRRGSSPKSSPTMQTLSTSRDTASMAKPTAKPSRNSCLS